MTAPSTYNKTGVQIYEALLEPLLKPFRQVVTRVCQHLGSTHVLDVGCGPAVQGLMLAEQGITCTGLDNAPAMLAATNGQMQAAHGRLTVMQGDATALPFADKSVDTVLMSLILHQMGEPLRTQTLNEAVRVGRRVVLADFRLPERNLDYPGASLARFAERLAGRVHYGHYRQFMGQGGLEGLMYALCSACTPRASSTLGTRVLLRKSALMGAVTVAALDVQ